MSINEDIARLRGYEVEKDPEIGLVLPWKIHVPGMATSWSFQTEKLAWEYVIFLTGDFEHSADACIKVCKELGREWSKAILGGYTIKVSIMILGKLIVHRYKHTTFALALKAALEGEKG